MIGAPRRSWNRKGVSEIIANLLILAITVTLFSGIFWYVDSMPTPSEKVYTDFSPTVQINSNKTAWINITDIGGEPLASSTTAIYLFQDNNITRLSLSSSRVPLGTQFSTGETWVYLKHGNVGTNTSLSVEIVDTAANTVIWNSVLQGGVQTASSSPIIGDRGLTPSPTYSGAGVKFYATVTDPYGILRTNSVYVNATSIGLGFVKLTYSGSGSTYYSNSYTANSNWNGATVIFNATDSLNHHSTASTVLSVLPQTGSGSGNTTWPYTGNLGALNNGTYPANASGGEAGGNDGTTFYYIERTSDNHITKYFSSGQGVTVQLWSNTLQNTAYGDAFYLYQPVTGGTIGPQTSLKAFQMVGFINGFYEFIYNFTAPTQAGNYPLSIQLEDNNGVIVNIADSINVGNGVAATIGLYKQRYGKPGPDQ